MTYIYEFFPNYLPNKSSENYIEVFDFHEGEYGLLFYKGKKIFNFQGEHYFEKIKSFSNMNKLLKAGLDPKKGNFLVYEMTILKEHIFNNFSWDKNQFSNYEELKNDIELDLVDINKAVKLEENKINSRNKNVNYKFLTHHGLD